MTRTTIILNLTITKRFMLGQHQRQQVQEQPVQQQPEIQQDPIVTVPQTQERPSVINTINNEPVCAPDNLNVHLIEGYVITNPILRAVDLSMRHGISTLAAVSLSLGKVLTSSKELDVAYVQHLQATEAVSKKLDEAQKAPWIPQWVQNLMKTWIIGSVSFVSIVFFLYKAWQLGMIPDFTSKTTKLVGHLMQPVASSNIQDIPKPNITAAFQTFAETPLAPLTILAFVGAAGISMGVLKLMLMIIQRAPK